MDEILSSIRRMISEEADGKTGVAPAEQDILELTDRVEADGSVVSLAPRGETSPAAVVPDEPAAKPATEPSVAETPPKVGVISENVAAASIAALSELVREVPRSPAAAVASSDSALEEATRALLKPLLRAWLDANLPALIERIVREEIARLVRDARGN